MTIRINISFVVNFVSVFRNFISGIFILFIEYSVFNNGSAVSIISFFVFYNDLVAFKSRRDINVCFVSFIGNIAFIDVFFLFVRNKFSVIKDICCAVLCKLSIFKFFNPFICSVGFLFIEFAILNYKCYVSFRIFYFIKFFRNNVMSFAFFININFLSCFFQDFILEFRFGKFFSVINKIAVFIFCKVSTNVLHLKF